MGSRRLSKEACGVPSALPLSVSFHDSSERHGRPSLLSFAAV